MKRIFCCFLVVVSILLSGCGDNEYSVYEKINKRYYSLPSYEAEGTIIYYTNKTKNKYSFKEYYNGEDIHLIHYIDDDLKLLVRNDGVFCKYNQNDKAVRISDADDGYKYIFPDCFFESYYSKETSSIESNSDYVTLETDCSDGYISSVRIWIDTVSLNPHKIRIYDVESEIVCEIVFDSFNTEVQNNAELFTF